MKTVTRILMLTAILSASLVGCHAQTHSATLNYAASTDSTPTNPGAVGVFRTPNACPASGIGTFTYTTLTTTAPAGGPYVDTTIIAGTTYCYYVTAIINGVSSVPSNTAGAGVPVPTAPPGSLTVGQK